MWAKQEKAGVLDEPGHLAALYLPAWSFVNKGVLAERAHRRVDGAPNDPRAVARQLCSLPIRGHILHYWLAPAVLHRLHDLGHEDKRDRQVVQMVAGVHLDHERLTLHAFSQVNAVEDEIKPCGEGV
jgi:hypothetical protein